MLSINNTGQSALHEAVLLGDLKEARQLAAAGQDVNAMDENGTTPLHLACSLPSNTEGGAGAMVSLLLGLGADPDAADNKGLTPQDMAETMNKQAIPYLEKARQTNTPAKMTTEEYQRTIARIKAQRDKG